MIENFLILKNSHLSVVSPMFCRKKWRKNRFKAEKSSVFCIVAIFFGFFKYQAHLETKLRTYQFVALSLLYRMVYKRICLTQKNYRNTFKLWKIGYKKSYSVKNIIMNGPKISSKKKSSLYEKMQN